MSVYIVVSRKNSLVAMFSSFTGKDRRCTLAQTGLFVFVYPTMAEGGKLVE